MCKHYMRMMTTGMRVPSSTYDQFGGKEHLVAPCFYFKK